MIQQKLNVDELFEVLKQRKTEITKQDFAKALGDKVKSLTSIDLNYLFDAIDEDKSGAISLTEIQTEFASIDCAMIMK